MEAHALSQPRVQDYIGLGAVLSKSGTNLRRTSCQGGIELHTMMGVIATFAELFREMIATIQFTLKKTTPMRQLLNNTC